MKYFFNHPFLILVMLFFCSVSFSQTEKSEKQKEVPEPVAATTVSAEDVAMPAPALKTDALSIEDSLRMRDPFQRPAKYADTAGDITVPELERYTLDQLKIVGIITGPKKAKALLTIPGNKMFIVQENDKLGNRKGFIKKIKDRSMIIREKIVNLVGQEESIDTELKFVDASKDQKKEKRL